LASLLTVGQAWRLDVQSALRGASPRLAGGSHARLARSLVALQFGLSLTLLAGAGLMVRNVLRLLEARLGFDPSDVVTIRIDPPWFKYSKLDQSVPFFRRVLEEIATLPGVEAAAANDALPLTDQDTQAGPAQLEVLVEGQSPAEAQENPVTAAQIVSHGYFDTLRIPLVAGRTFEDGDRAGSPDVALVSQRTAERFWPGRSALGRRLKLGLRGANYRPAAGDEREEPWVSVIGVVGNVRRDVLSPPAYDVYLSDRQRFVPETYLAVRGRGDPFALAAAVRTAVMRVDPEQSIFDIRTMDTRLKDRVWHQRLSGTALAVLAAVALGLAAIGLYGLVARSVAARRREIAVRASLGAGPADIVRLVIGDVVPLLALGVGGGLLAVLALRPVVVRLMHAPVATDWLVVPAMAVTLAAVALIAAFVPARRAARGSPALALRD
jgi:putative ABC transport system permease protein